MKLIYNPFEKFSENRLLIFGLLCTLAGSAIAWQCNGRYDGAIDMHLGSNVQWWQPLIDNAINTVSLGGLLFALGYYFNKRTRLIDVLNATLIARSPFYLLPLSNIGGFMAKATENIIAAGADISKIAPGNLIVLVIMGFLSIGILVWAMALLYNGFKVATNIKTTPQIIAFVVTILLAEALSKMLIINLPY
jgi:hypothetical protein